MGGGDLHKANSTVTESFVICWSEKSLLSSITVCIILTSPPDKSLPPPLLKVVLTKVPPPLFKPVFGKNLLKTGYCTEFGFLGKLHSCHQNGLKRTLLSGLKKKGHFCLEKDSSILKKTLLSKIYLYSDWCYKIISKKTLLSENKLKLNLGANSSLFIVTINWLTMKYNFNIEMLKLFWSQIPEQRESCCG